MAVTLSPLAGAGWQFFDNNGNPLSGGLLYTYAAGTSTPLATYTTVAGTIQNSNPIVLDAAGRPPQEIWLTVGYGYKFILQDANAVLIKTYDNIPSNAPSPFANDASSVAYEQGYSVTAGSFVVGKTYLITSVGNTNFVAIGASSNAPGVYFTATGVGSGTGTAELSRSVQTKLQESISVKDFGAVGDFNPVTGSGTDDRIAIQAAFNYAASVGNCKVIFPQGKYYLGTGYSESSGGGLKAQVYLGSAVTTNAASYVDVEGYGAALYQGNTGCAFYIGNANHCSVRGLSIYGYAGGTISRAREFDTVFMIGQNSEFIDVRDCYFTNSLGYTAGVTGNPNAGDGGTIYTCQNISFIGNTFKTRYGNGYTPVQDPVTGTKSLWAFFTIDIQSLTFKNNMVYGVVDLEPNNLAGQSLSDVDVSNNQFLSGFVTPIAAPGSSVSTYWADEVINKGATGGTIIPQGVNVEGSTGAPYIRNVSVRSNSFDYGTVAIGAVYKAFIKDNVFYLGKINVGTTSGGNVNRYYDVSNNTCDQVTDATSGFIVFNGDISESKFHNNFVTRQDMPVVSWNGVDGRDVGGNSYVGNASPLNVTVPTINVPYFTASSTKLATTDAYPELKSFITSLTDGTNSATLSTNTLYYRVEGRQVTFTVRLFVTSAGSIGAAGSVYITLPITANSTSSMRYIVNVSPIQNFAFNANVVQMFGYIEENTARCYISEVTSAGVLQSIDSGNFAANASLIISGSYYTN